FASDGIGSIQHHKGNSVLCGGLHREAYGRNVGADARPDALYVEHEDVDILQHLGTRLAGLAVEAVDGGAGTRITTIRHLLAGIGCAPDAVFGAEKSRELDLGALVDEIHEMDRIHHGRMVDDQSDPMPLEEVESAIGEDLSSGAHILRGRIGARRRHIAASRDEKDRSGERDHTYAARGCTAGGSKVVEE